MKNGTTSKTSSDPKFGGEFNGDEYPWDPNNP